MRVTLPEPGTPAGDRLTTLLSAAAVLVAVLGLGIAVASLALRDPVLIVSGAAVVAAGVATLVCTQGMARNEQALAALKRTDTP